MITSISQIDQIERGSLILLKNHEEKQFIAFTIDVFVVHKMNCKLYMVFVNKQIWVATDLISKGINSLDFIPEHRNPHHKVLSLMP